MAIQFPDFQRISFDEANPWLVGAERGQKFAQSAIQFPLDMKSKMLANQIAEVQAQYAEPMAKQELTAKEQANQWNPKIWQSEIGLRGAQAQHNVAQAGYLGKQTQWYDQEAKAKMQLQQAQAQEAQANAAKAAFLQKALQEKFSGAYQTQGEAPPARTTGEPTEAGGVSTQNARPSEQYPAVQSMYGIDTPQPTKDDYINKMVFGIDTFTPRSDAAKQQQIDQYKEIQKSVSESIQRATTANKAKQVLAIFNKAMDESYYKGASLGDVPSSGWKSALIPGDLTPEQTADYQVANLLPGAISELRDAMKSGQFSVADLNAASRMKVSRSMNDETRHTQSAWLNGVYDRMDEQSKFLSMLGNPRSGASKINADQLWEQYQRDFPLISNDGSKFLGSNLGNWPLYTTPRAIASIKTTGTYTPSKQEKETFMMEVPDGKGGYVIMPIKKGRVEAAFKKGARPL